MIANGVVKKGVTYVQRPSNIPLQLSFPENPREISLLTISGIRPEADADKKGFPEP
jgi:hypothetical protein